MSLVYRHTEVIDQEDRFVGGWLARERVLSAVAETVEKAAEVPRAGGGGSEWRVEEWSSPAGLSRARRRELRMVRGRGGSACNRSTILLRSFAQSFCMPTRSAAASFPRTWNRSTISCKMGRGGMRLDVEG